MTIYGNAGGLKDSPQATTEFTLTDYTSKFTLDCDTDNAAAIANVLATLVLELIRKGIIKGTVETT
jgi:hypothetical protein